MKALIYYNNMYEGEGYKEVTAHKVEVPFIQAFATKAGGKYWQVHELTTGVRVGTYHKDRFIAVQSAVDTLTERGETATLKALEGHPKVPATLNNLK